MVTKKNKHVNITFLFHFEIRILILINLIYDNKRIHGYEKFTPGVENVLKSVLDQSRAARGYFKRPFDNKM